MNEGTPKCSFTKVDGGVTAPKGFKASGVAVGLKPGTSNKDCALMVSEVPAAVGGVFTKNIVKAAPVYWDMAICEHGNAQAVFVHTANANAVTGEQGKADCKETAEQVGERLGIEANDVCVCSTGVIGVPLPMKLIRKGIKRCVSDLSNDGNLDAATAILTTDTVPKETALSLKINGKTVRIGAMAKGAGMIAPDMATMICIITTDADLDSESVHALVKDGADASFNRMCIDNDMSTNDTVLCLANGVSGVRIEAKTANYGLFDEAFTAVCQEMAKGLVRDGEGATKFIEIQVKGASDDAKAKDVAKSIATSQLCKTAFFGEDANWGRFACAAGYAGVAFDPDVLDIWIGDLQLLAQGQPTGHKEEQATALMKADDIVLRVSIGSGPGESVFWTSDLSHEYVNINADYRT